MKRLKFLIVAVAAFAAHGVWAVTLPTTSYTQYNSDESYSSEFIGGGLSTVKGVYQELGTVDPEAAESCKGSSPGVPKTGATCADCCMAAYNCGSSSDPDCGRNYLSCINGCEQGASLPLDAPLWFMLVIAVLSVTLRAYARRVSQAA